MGVFGSMYDSFSSTNAMIRSSPACSRKKNMHLSCVFDRKFMVGKVKNLIHNVAFLGLLISSILLLLCRNDKVYIS